MAFLPSKGYNTVKVIKISVYISKNIKYQEIILPIFSQWTRRKFIQGISFIYSDSSFHPNFRIHNTFLNSYKEDEETRLLTIW